MKDERGYWLGRGMSEFKNFAMGVLMLALAAYGAVKASMYYHARYRVNQLLAPLSQVARVTYGDVNVSLFGPVGISDLSIVDPSNGATVTVDNATVHDFQYARGEFLPRHLSLTLDGVHANTTLRRELRADPPVWLRHSRYEAWYRDGLDPAGLGYEEIVADIALNLHYDADSGGLRLRYYASAKDMGTLRLRVEVSGLTRTDLRRGLAKLSLRSASFDYRDASFVQRLIAKEARRRKIPVAQYQRELAALVDTEINSDEIKLDAASTAATKQFLVRPQHLLITMAPYEAVPLRDLRFYKPGDIPMLLNTQVSN